MDLAGRCTGTSFSEDGQNTSECLQDGPVAMYAKDGSKVGDLLVCLDIHFKKQAQRTSFELNELLSQTDPTLQLYPSHAKCDSLGMSFTSASDTSMSMLQLSTVLEASQEAASSNTQMSTHSTPQDSKYSSRKHSSTCFSEYSDPSSEHSAERSKDRINELYTMNHGALFRGNASLPAISHKKRTDEGPRANSMLMLQVSRCPFKIMCSHILVYRH